MVQATDAEQFVKNGPESFDCRTTFSFMTECRMLQIFSDQITADVCEDKAGNCTD